MGDYLKLLFEMGAYGIALLRDMACDITLVRDGGMFSPLFEMGECGIFVVRDGSCGLILARDAIMWYNPCSRWKHEVKPLFEIKACGMTLVQGRSM
ncbi:hypothetical protein DPMN_114019 [Dreissena polymorpha]|uniref:Uncharacterized protein n=1 Tax=Dreissena polymorpha TaxID=45954 RepID=A0A9D4QRC1_DREPO|nr:hypothetical protein DPMN_114019 [Dreissena polymorpha]